jgi:hypothetical protein
MRAFFSAFFTANLLLASFYLDIWCTPNPVSRALPVLALLQDGTLAIDRFADLTPDKARVGGRYYSDKAPLPTLAAVPFFGLLQAAGLTETTETTGRRYPVHVWRPVTGRDGRDRVVPQLVPLLLMSGLLFASLPFAAMVLLALKRSAGMKGGLPPVALSMVAFYGSFLFVFAGTFFNHLLAGLLLLLSYIGLEQRRYFRSGLWLGLSLLAEYTVAAALLLWAPLVALRERRPKQVALFLLGALPAVVFLLGYNLATTGHLFRALNAYHDYQAFAGLHEGYGFRFPSLQALWGLSFSFYLGLFTHAPVLLLCAYFLVREMLEGHRWRTLWQSYLFAFSVPFFLLISSFFTWWGGWSYGPRYLGVLAALLLYEGVNYLADKRTPPLVFWAVGGLGLASTWIAKVTVMYMIPDGSSELISAPGESSYSLYPVHELLHGRFNANNVLTLAFDVPPAVAAFTWLLLFFAVILAFSLWYRRMHAAVSSER